MVFQRSIYVCLVLGSVFLLDPFLAVGLGVSFILNQNASKLGG